MERRVVADLQTPWLLKLLSGGEVADDISYYFYFFLGERGEVAGIEDAYLQFTDIAGSGVSVIAGQFQVSDPMFKRELRLEYEDYQPYRVRVGDTRADLTYDRGLMATWSPRDGTDLVFEVVNGQGLSAIREVGPGSHFLGCAHTQANFEIAFWRSMIADNNSFEQWRDDGQKDAAQRANETWKKMLRDYEAPAIDPGLDEALQAFMAKRKEKLPDSVA